MVKTEKISDFATENKLCDLVFEKLVTLPAYKLRGKSQQVFDKYLFSETDKLIKSKSLNSSILTIEDRDINNNKTFFEAYQKPNELKIFWLSCRMSFNKNKTLFAIVVSSLLLAFLARANSILLIIIGIIAFFIFSISYIIYIYQFAIWYSDANSTFSIIDRTHKNIRDYISNFKNISDNNLPTKVNIITENIIKDEISGLAYDLRKLDIFNILFAFFVSLLFVFIFDKSLIEEIKWVANIINFSNFELIENLTTETFIFIILFPLAIPFSNFINVSSLKQRDKKLRQSLVIVENSIKPDLADISSQEDVQRRKQLTITELFGTIEYEDDYDYKEQRRHS